MKTFPYMLLLLLSACASSHHTGILSIHLAADQTNWEAVLKDASRLDSMELAPRAILSDRDFLSYDSKSHAFVIAAEAARRLSRELHGGEGLIEGEEVYDLTWVDTPFCLVVSGERVYGGLFSTIGSSYRHSYKAPTITADIPYVSASSKKGMRFTIERGPWHPEVDVRCDRRVLKAIKRLGVPATSGSASLDSSAAQAPGEVVRVNGAGQFVVLRFPFGEVPAVGRRLKVVRQGLKVGEVKITTPSGDDLTAAEIVAGEAQAGDGVLRP